ncbi:MAG: hypothetical protein GY754_11825 [bacterium]|nr:hypothetical protein [bacterium]
MTLKKCIILYIIFHVVFFLNCSTVTTGTTGTIKTGWLNEETLVVKGYGKAEASIRNQVRKKVMAREKAMLDAQGKVVKAVLGLSVKEYEELMGAFRYTTDKSDPYLRGGSVIKEKFDSQGNCLIYYRVQKKGLRAYARKNTSVHPPSND